jgi:hypothetical protein
MNRVRFLFAAALAGAMTMSFSVALAQHNHEEHAAAEASQATQSSQSSTQMKGGGPPADRMMMGMMNDPVHQSAMVAFVLPELQTELGLSAQQVTDLRKLKQDLVTKTKDMATEPKNKELEATLTQMKAALTEPQRTKLAAMKPADIHSLAMSKVPMNEHMTMAGFSTDGRMGRGMMKGGMMNNGMMKDGLPQGGMGKKGN